MQVRINEILIILILLMISFCLLLISPDISAETEFYTDPSYPQVEIKGIWGGRTAKVGTGDTGIVNFNCSVEVNFPQGYYNPASTINVSLKTEDEWNAWRNSYWGMAYDFDGLYSMLQVKVENKESVPVTISLYLLMAEEQSIILQRKGGFQRDSLPLSGDL